MTQTRAPRYFFWLLFSSTIASPRVTSSLDFFSGNLREEIHWSLCYSQQSGTCHSHIEITHCGRWERRVVHSHQRRGALSSLSLSSQGLELPTEPHAGISLRYQRRGTRYIRPMVLEDQRRKHSRGSTYVEAYFLAYWAISSSVFAEASGSQGAMTYPSHALAVVNLLASLMAATIV